MVKVDDASTGEIKKFGLHYVVMLHPGIITLRRNSHSSVTICQVSNVLQSEFEELERPEI